MAGTLRKLKRRSDFIGSSQNSDRWMVSYADFVTLLFGFFLTMYALSSINEGRYRVLAQSIAAAFANTQIQEEVESSERPPPIEDTKDKDDVIIKKMGDSIVKAMTSWIDRGLIKVNISPVMLQIDINASALFASGSSTISADATPILESLANILSNFPNAIHVEGFTDNKPIRTPVFPSNWELSAARAATVVRMFGNIGIEPTRMASVGYGEFHPVADNETDAGRARNRRVVIVVLSGNDPRAYINVADNASEANDQTEMVADSVPSGKPAEQEPAVIEAVEPQLDDSIPMVPIDDIQDEFSIDDIATEDIPL